MAAPSAPPVAPPAAAPDPSAAPDVPDTGGSTWAIGFTPDGALLSHDQDVQPDTQVWMEGDGEENAVPYSDVQDEYGDDLSVLDQPAPYPAPNDGLPPGSVPPNGQKPVTAAILEAVQTLGTRMSVMEDHFAVIAALNAPTPHEFPTPVTEELLRGAVAGEAPVVAALDGVFHEYGDPSLSPSAFAAKILGDAPDPTDPFASTFDSAARLARLHQAKSMAVRASLAPATMEPVAKPEPSDTVDAPDAPDAPTEPPEPPVDELPDAPHGKVAPEFLANMKNHFGAHGVINQGPAATMTKSPAGYAGMSPDHHSNLIEALRGAGMNVKTNSRGGGFAKAAGHKFPLANSPGNPVFDGEGRLLHKGLG